MKLVEEYLVADNAQWKVLSFLVPSTLIFSSWKRQLCCCCLVAKLHLTALQPHGLLQPTRLFCSWDSPGKKTVVVAMSFSRGSTQLRDWTCISLLAGGFLPLNHQGFLPLDDFVTNFYVYSENIFCIYKYMEIFCCFCRKGICHINIRITF